jgi:outer membrane protein TolC
LRPRILAILLLASPACVSSRAGFDEAQSALRGRGGLTIPEPDDDPSVARARAALLKKPLNADAAAKLAVLANPEVRVELAQLGVAAGDLGRALQLPNPELTGRVLFHESTVDLDFDAGLSITSLAMIPGRADAADAALEAAAWRTAARALDVSLAARVAFYDYMAARQTLELDRTVAAAAGEAANLAQRLLEAGNVPEPFATNERAFADEATLALADAELGEATARERLVRALGVQGADADAIRTPEHLGSLPATEVDVANLEPTALRTSLDLAIARKLYEANAAATDLARAEGFTPDVIVGVGVERDANLWGVGPSLGLRLPLFYQGQGEALSAESRMRAARSSHDALALAIRESARTLGPRLETARARVRFYEERLLPLRQEALNQTLLQYNAMNAGLFQLLSAKREQVLTARGYVAALRDYWVTRAMVEQLSRGRLPASPELPAVAPAPTDRGSPHE